jgi:uncharacterized protein YhfF
MVTTKVNYQKDEFGNVRDTHSNTYAKLIIDQIWRNRFECATCSSEHHTEIELGIFMQENGEDKVVLERINHACCMSFTTQLRLNLKQFVIVR